MSQRLKVKLRKSKKDVNLRQLRKDGYVPGVIFGREMESVSIKIEESLLTNHLFQRDIQTFEIEIEIDDGDVYTVNIESKQKDVVSGKVLHISFLTSKI